MQSRAAPRPACSAGLKRRALFHTLLSWRATRQLKCPLSSRRGAKVEVISQQALGTVTLIEHCFSPRKLELLSDLIQLLVTVKQVNNNLKGSGSIVCSLVLISHCAASLLLLFSCCAVTFLALCIMYIPYLSDMYLLLCALGTLGGVLMCLPVNLAGC